MDIKPEWITLVFACNATIASIAGLFINTKIAQTEFKAKVLSVNRQKWIDTLRDLVASLNSQLLATAAIRHTMAEPTGVVLAKDPELFRRVENLLRTVFKVELMLNPLERDHQQLKILMKAGLEQLRSPSLQGSLEEHIEIVSGQIILVSQGILKREWARVKRGE
jgi:hypothetical protein